MKNLKIRFTPEAARLLSKLHPESKKLIKSALQKIHKEPFIGNDLQEELFGFKSYKSKRYRIIYKINEENQIIEVYYVGHRRDVYEQFRRLLNQLASS
jgi:mRNA-degrading endonuclease RelE of RelBE toxin-antitoxin system